MTGEKITDEAYKIIIDKKSFAVNVEEGVNIYKLTQGEEREFKNQIILPILSKEGDGMGLIALYGGESSGQINANVISLVRLACSVLSCGE